MKILSVSVAVLTGACAVATDLRGTFSDTGERFTGQSINLSGNYYAGTLQLLLVGGVKCDGVYAIDRATAEGHAKFHCSDGRSGRMSIKSTGWAGSAHGHIGDRAFTLVF